MFIFLALIFFFTKVYLWYNIILKNISLKFKFYVLLVFIIKLVCKELKVPLSQCF